MPKGIYVRTKEHIEKLRAGQKGHSGIYTRTDEMNELHSKACKCKTGTYKRTEEHKKITSVALNRPETKIKTFEAAAKRMERQLLKGTARFMNTDIEMLMYEGLLSRGFIVEKQKQIKRIVRVDFYLPEHNIVIECDSEYWHNLPGRQERDKIRTEKMQVLNYKVLRFWGNDIKHNLQDCLNKIQAVINV